MNITATNSSGTHPLWIISTVATTTITRAATGSALISAAEDASHHVAISGIYFAYGSGAINCINTHAIAEGKPILIHNCFAEIVYAGDNSLFLRSYGPRGLVYNCSFIGAPISNGGQAIMIHPEMYDAWLTSSTMGTTDTTGLANFYIEDCDFHGMINSADLSNNCRAVIRNCIFNNAGIGSHGPDTGTFGLRHFELYNNEFIFNGYNDGQTMPIDYLIYIRGGTGVISDNIIPNLSSTDYGDKTEIKLQIQMLARNAGPNPLWSDNDGGMIQYPSPRQVGMGRVTGTGVDGKGRKTDMYTYVGDSEPLYIWNNAGSYVVSVNTGYEGGGGGAINPDPASAYIVHGRDYFNNGTAKPGWSKPAGTHPAAYPHSLRAGPPQFVRILVVK